ncbi:MAG: adenosylmethionine decarboxylase [Hyphomonadaceae bacterium]
MFDAPVAPESALGLHYIIEFFGARNLEDCAPVQTALRDAAELAGAVVLDENIHDFGEGQGVTGVVLLAESHISIHTWPEHNYAAIDIFMCGDRVAPEKSLEHLRDFFRPENESVNRLQRGLMPAQMASD